MFITIILIPKFILTPTVMVKDRMVNNKNHHKTTQHVWKTKMWMHFSILLFLFNLSRPLIQISNLTPVCFKHLNNINNRIIKFNPNSKWEPCMTSYNIMSKLILNFFSTLSQLCQYNNYGSNYNQMMFKCRVWSLHLECTLKFL